MKIIIIIICLMSVKYVYAELKLPECTNNQSSLWNDCRGAIVINLSAYVGEFKNGLPEGYGTFTYSDGAVYVGSFKEGKEHGNGIFTCWTHGSQYTGQFQNGKKHGTWVAFHPGGRMPSVITNDKKGKLNGIYQTYTGRGQLFRKGHY